MNYEAFTSIKNHLITFNLSALIRVICGWRYSTIVESSLQIDLFMQNKPNFPKSQMNVNTYNKTDYENKRNWTIGQSKPNSNPIKPNFQKAKMNVNSFTTEDYRKKDDFVVRINKPNSNPISEKHKMNANAFSQKDYENETALRFEQSKPKQTQFQTAHLLIDRTKLIYYYGIW